jgi:hypothetical protein
VCSRCSWPTILCTEPTRKATCSGICFSSASSSNAKTRSVCYVPLQSDHTKAASLLTGLMEMQCNKPHRDVLSTPWLSCPQPSRCVVFLLHTIRQLPVGWIPCRVLLHGAQLQKAWSSCDAEGQSWKRGLRMWRPTLFKGISGPAAAAEHFLLLNTRGCSVPLYKRC